MPLRQALTEARKLKLAGLELEAAGELAPARLGQTGRRELRQLLQSHDLAAAALFAPLRRGLDVPEDLDRRLDYLKQALTLSYDLGSRLLAVQVGKLPQAGDQGPGDRGQGAGDRGQESGFGGQGQALENARLATMHASLADLSRHGDRVGARLALEAGLDPPQAMCDFLARFDTGSLTVCYNPGALLAAGFDPYDALRVFNKRMAHAHARDARLISAMGRAQEVPLGHGDVDWLQLAATFAEIDYRGWLVIDGDSLGSAQVASSAQLLRRIFGAAS